MLLTDFNGGFDIFMEVLYYVGYMQSAFSSGKKFIFNHQISLHGMCSSSLSCDRKGQILNLEIRKTGEYSGAVMLCRF